jgi:hypothetical protein
MSRTITGTFKTTYVGCLRCGNNAINGFHCAVNGNDYNFCSIECIQKYSFQKGCRVTILECLNDGTRICDLGRACDGCSYFYRIKKPKVKVILI